MGITNYPDGVDGSHPYFNEPEPIETEIIDEEAEATAIKRLALAQALYKNVSAMVKTGDEFNLRGEVDMIMRDRFAQAKKLGLAPKSFDIEIDGEKVGTYSISTTKPTKAETRQELRVKDSAEYLSWAIENGFVIVDQKAVDNHFKSCGEIPDGCEVVPTDIPATQGGQISKTTLRIDPLKVEHSLGADLQEMTAWMLGSGEDL